MRLPYLRRTAGTERAVTLIELLDRHVAAAHDTWWRRPFRQPLRIARSRWLHARARWMKQPVSAATRTFWGAEMHVLIPECVSASIVRLGYHEETLTRMLLSVLEPGMVFVDVGAHFGYYSLLAAHLVGETGQVHAFEPIPETFTLLEHNTRMHANVRRIQAAVFSHEETLEFVDPGPALSAFASFARPRLDEQLQPALVRRPKVRALSLDEYFQSRDRGPDVIKIDAESAEWFVLQGMQRILTRDRPVVSLETGDLDVPDITSTRAVVDHLIGFGYTAWEYGSSDEPLRRHEPRKRYDYDNLVFLPHAS